ncbi:Uncharacterised protein [Yersinia enterocolitica]|nr:Uncharacterised protein [Yersinia enterocolitica]
MAFSDCSPGIWLSANTMAIAIKPGKAGIMMLRILILFSRLLSLPGIVASPLPNTGVYFICQYLHNEAVKEIARVRLLVPVVPEVAMTFAPLEVIIAIEVPPVPTIGIFFSIAARIASLLLRSGSALIMMMPSIAPARICAAMATSEDFTASFTSDSFPWKLI